MPKNDRQGIGQSGGRVRRSEPASRGGSDQTHLLLQILEDSRRSHASTDAHGDHPVAPMTTLEFADDGCRQLRSGAAERVAERNRSSVRVDAPEIEARFLNYAERLGGEGFIQLDHVNIRQLQTGKPQGLRDRVHRPQAHFFRLVSCGGKRHVAH